jgi:hypothetical protein
MSVNLLKFISQLSTIAIATLQSHPPLRLLAPLAFVVIFLMTVLELVLVGLGVALVLNSPKN